MNEQAQGETDTLEHPQDKAQAESSVDPAVETVPMNGVTDNKEAPCRVTVTPLVKPDGTLVAYLHEGDIIRTVSRPDMAALKVAVRSCGISEYKMDQDEADQLADHVEDCFAGTVDHGDVRAELKAEQERSRLLQDELDRANEHAQLLQDQLGDSQAENERLHADVDKLTAPGADAAAKDPAAEDDGADQSSGGKKKKKSKGDQPSTDGEPTNMGEVTPQDQSGQTDGDNHHG